MLKLTQANQKINLDSHKRNRNMLIFKKLEIFLFRINQFPVHPHNRLKKINRQIKVKVQEKDCNSRLILKLLKSLRLDYKLINELILYL